MEAQEKELKRQLELDRARRGLYENGKLSEAELQEGRRALRAVQKDVDDTHRAIMEADRMLKEAEEASNGRVDRRP